MENVHSRMKSIHDEYLADLVATGMSECDAVRCLATIRNWSEDAFFPRLRRRRDEYSCSAERRMRLAEEGLDFCEFWLRLQSGGASERQLDEFTRNCEDMSVQDILYWLSCNNLTEIYVCGRRIRMAEAEAVD